MSMTNEKPARRPSAWVLAAAGALVLAGALSGCGAKVMTHGHILSEDDIQQVREGMSKDQVTLALGTPDTKSTAGHDAFYYISTTTKRQLAFMAPEVVDRRVVAIYFDKSENVQRIANYGLKDGRVIDFSTQKTPTYGGEDGLLKSLFRNIGGRPSGVMGPDQ